MTFIQIGDFFLLANIQLNSYYEHFFKSDYTYKHIINLHAKSILNLLN